VRLPSVQDVVDSGLMSRDAYLSLLERQGVGCGICGRHVVLRLDRDTNRGEVRGLLCSSCLDGLRSLDGDLRRLLRSYFYLAYPPIKFASQRHVSSKRYARNLRRWLRTRAAAETAN
jgi:hypothetical protein